jgi:hypothetical protein
MSLTTRPWCAAEAVLVDQVRAIDRGARRLRLAGVAPQSVVAIVQAKLAALFGIAG